MNRLYNAQNDNEAFQGEVAAIIASHFDTAVTNDERTVHFTRRFGNGDSVTIENRGKETGGFWAIPPLPNKLPSWSISIPARKRQSLSTWFVIANNPVTRVLLAKTDYLREDIPGFVDVAHNRGEDWILIDGKFFNLYEVADGKLKLLERHRLEINNHTLSIL